MARLAKASPGVQELILATGAQDRIRDVHLYEAMRTFYFLCHCFLHVSRVRRSLIHLLFCSLSYILRAAACRGEGAGRRDGGGGKEMRVRDEGMKNIGN